MSPVETLLAEVLAAHQWRDVQGNYEVAPYIKHFGCSCGWLQDVAGMSGFRSWQGVHIAHVAAEQAKVLRRAYPEESLIEDLIGGAR